MAALSDRKKRVAWLEAEVARLTAELERLKAAKASKSTAK